LKGQASEDFASSAMVRVLARGMVRLGLRPPVLAADLLLARIPLDLKRTVLQSAIEQGGLACLPLLGRGLHDLAMEPTHLALTTGRSAGAMFMRWQRLERYIHSTHRIRMHALGGTSARVEHVHKDHGPRPLPVEDLVVCGVLCALLEANGLTAVVARANGVALYPSPDPDMLSRCAEQQETGLWSMSWSSSAQAAAASDLSASWAQVSPHVWTPFARAVGDLVARHLPELLPVDAAASAVGMSRRSFQRSLASEALTYQQLQADVRFRLAGWNLLHQDMTIAEVGFVHGYSDQAHLTREFNRRVGVPPAKYRELFAANGSWV
jgi:AraC-like DNA-binding protein